MINLYSTHCPKCIVLEKKLNSKNIEFNIKDREEDINYLIENNFMSVPILEIDNNFYTFEEAVKLVGTL